jgi:hypothetical protein
MLKGFTGSGALELSVILITRIFLEENYRLEIIILGIKR